MKRPGFWAVARAGRGGSGSGSHDSRGRITILKVCRAPLYGAGGRSFVEEGPGFRPPRHCLLLSPARITIRKVSRAPLYGAGGRSFVEEAPDFRQPRHRIILSQVDEAFDVVAL